ncbi:MAG: cytochrome c oxidase subunit II [Planctomycetes bacterium]|nr:cytochrome c oxidase subunit II [Planctomycetota bacterium]
MNLLSPMFLLLAQTGGTGGGFWFPESASTVAPEVDFAFDFITGISIFFFVLIVGVMLWFMFKYRRRGHLPSMESPTHNTPLEITWTAIPMILVVLIFYIGLKGYVNITTPPENSYEIEAVGQQWYWSFNYPNGATDINILHVPVGRPVKINLRSNDVIHDLFIPAFRVKMDAVPGRRTELWFEATREGEFELYCAEYCGTQHSQMVGKVIVYNQFAFEAKIDELANWLDKVPDEDLHKAGVILYNYCSTCHTVDGSPLIGPSFQETHELFKSGGTRKLADGSAVTVNEDYLRSSIRKPSDQIAASAQGVAYPSSMTPNIADQLGTRGVEAMIQMLMRLDELVDAEGKLKKVERADIVVGTEEPQ